MTRPVNADPPSRKLRLWSSWLWVLAAILGAGALWSGVRVVHDNRLHRETMRVLAQDKAAEVAILAGQRFDLLVADAFGSALLDDGDPGNHGADRLAKNQQQRVNRRHADTLPVIAFFQFDATTSRVYDQATQRLTVASVGSPPSSRPSDSVLTALARRDWDAALMENRPVVRLTIDSTVGDRAIVTVSRPSSWRGGTKIFGAMMPARAFAATLFSVIPLDPPGDLSPLRIGFLTIHLGDPTAGTPDTRAVHLDSLGLQVTAAGNALFGKLASQRIMASVTPTGPLGVLTVTVALSGRQVPIAMLMPVAHDRLWLNGLLMTCTILVMLFAIGSSRREVLLARARSDFIAGVSHDLRMPLAQILLASETLKLRRDRNDEDRDVLAATIVREARRLATLVENVLLFSRTGAVDLNPRLRPVPLNDLFRDVIEGVNLAVEDAGQTIEADADPSLRVTGDPGLLRQALVNLVDNAIKYGSPGQRIRLSAESRGGVGRITVEDQGPGIPPAQRSRLFEPYERLGRDQTSERTGSGLGLAVVRQIVIACGGSVHIEDGASGGTRVAIDLRLAGPEAGT